MPPTPRAEPYTEPYGSAAGWQEIVPIPNPAAGAPAIYKNPGEYYSRLISAVFRLACSGVAGNRAPRIQWEDGNGGIYALALNISNLTATQAGVFSGFAAVGSNGGTASNGYIFGIPDVFLEPGHLLRITAPTFDAGDQLSLIFLVFDRFPTEHVRRQHARR